MGLVAVIAACSVTPSPTASGVAGPTGPSDTTGLARFTQDEWGFDYPAAWRYYPIEGFVTSFYAVHGYLASIPVDTGRICQTTPSSRSCDARAYDLPPASVVITVGNGGIPMNDPVAFYDHPAEGMPVRAGDMPAVYQERRQAADRTLLTWKIARPTAFGNWVQLDADIRGPGEASLRSQVDALVASFRFVPQPGRISDDPAVARSIARAALHELKADSAYACVPDEAGSSRSTTITALPFGPPLGGPLPVTCSVTIAPTDVGFWRLDLVIAWGAGPGRKAGVNHTVQWLDPDGSLSAASNNGDTPGG